MIKRINFIFIVFIILNAGCNIFGSDNNSGDDSGWEKASMPKQLLSDWYRNGFHYMKITSTKVIIDNREWGIVNIYKKDSEYRIIGKSALQYKAFYFQNITDTTTEISMGYIAFTPYDVKTAARDSWIFIAKE